MTIFADLDFDAAMARATSEGKYLLVTTKSRRGREAWESPYVIELVGKYMIAIEVDAFHDRALYEKLRLDPQNGGLQVTIVYRKGTELDRVAGGATAHGVSTWLYNLLHGKTWLEARREHVAANPTDDRARIELAEMLERTGHGEEATRMFVEFWHQPSREGGRARLWLASLIRRYPEARAAFAKIRDELTPTADPDPRALHDWFGLNWDLGETDKTLAWFDSSYDAATATPQVAALVEETLARLLVKAGRWPDAGRLVRDPMGALRKLVSKDQRQRDPSLSELMLAERIMTQEEIQQLQPELRDAHRKSVGRLVRMLAAAKRDADAEAVADEARRLDPSAEMAAVISDGFELARR